MLAASALSLSLPLSLLLLLATASAVGTVSTVHGRPRLPFVDAAGLPFVPAGFYTRGDLNLREQLNGFNAVIRQHGIPRQGANNSALVAWLTRCDAAGASIFVDLSFLVQELWKTTNTTRCAELWNALAWSVRKAAVHPSVAGWYLADEPDHHSTSARLVVVRRAASVVRRADRASSGRIRPLIICVDTTAAYSSFVPHFADYTDIADVLFTDLYPIAGPGPAGPSSWRSPDLGGAIAEAFRALRNATDRPLLLVEQAFGQSQAWARSPSVQEERLMAYSSLIAGGQGLLYFFAERPATSAGLPTLPIPPFGGVNNRVISPLSPNLWSEMRRLALELAELTPALLSTLAPLATAASPAFIKTLALVEDTSERIYAKDAGGIVVLVANHRNHPQLCTVALTVPAGWTLTGAAQVLFQDRQISIIGATDGSGNGTIELSDMVDALGTRAYRLSFTRPTAGYSRPGSHVGKKAALEHVSDRLENTTRVNPANVVENPSFEGAIGGGGVPDGVRVLVGSDVDATIFADPRDSVEGLHSLRLHSPSGPDGLMCLAYGGHGGTEAATWYHPGSNWTLSIWARAVATAPPSNASWQGGEMPRLRLGINPYHELPWINNSWLSCEEQSSKTACIEPVLSKSWTRYSLPVTAPALPAFNYENPWVYFQQRGAGTVFLDLLQLVNASSDPI